MNIFRIAICFASTEPPTMNTKVHLLEAVRWSAGTRVDIATTLAAGLGLAGPILLAAAAGQLPLGLAAAAGALMAAASPGHTSGPGAGRYLAEVLAPALAAGAAAALIADRGGLTHGVLVLLAGTAATVGGCSRPLAFATVRFVLTLIIAVNLAAQMPDRLSFIVLFAVGALWTAVLTLMFLAAARLHRRADEPAPPAQRRYTHAQLRGRWMRTLRQGSGWQYPARLTACLAIAETAAWLWPNHHTYWITLTVALLTRRQPDPTPVRPIQRSAGTFLGVLAAAVLFARPVAPWILSLIVGVLGAARPLLAARNYLLYSAVMTPLVVLMMDGIGNAGSAGVLIDRLGATLIGTALVLAAGAMAARVIPQAA